MGKNKPMVVKVEGEGEPKVKTPAAGLDAPNGGAPKKKALTMDSFRGKPTNVKKPDGAAKEKSVQVGQKAKVATSAMPELRVAKEKVVEEKTFEKDTIEIEEEPRFSKPKAVAIAMGVTLVVGVLGGLMIWATSKKDAPEYCTVSYDANGGTEVEAVKIACGTKVVRPNMPTREGYEFYSWVKSGKDFEFDKEVITADTTLIARWKRIGASEPEEVPKEPEVAQVSRPQGGATSGGGNSNTSTEEPADQPEEPEKEEPVKLKSLAVTGKEVKAGEQVMLGITVEPKDAKVDLAVSNPGTKGDIATCAVVDDKVGCEAGTEAGTVTFELRDKLTGISTEFMITVVPAEVKATSVEIAEGATMTLTAGEEATLTARVLPEEAVNKDLEWSTSDSSVATVDATGKVTAKVAGMAVITAKVKGENVKATVTVTVKAQTVTPPEESEEPEESETPAGEE